MPRAIKKRIKKKTVTSETEVKDRLSDLRDSIIQKQRTIATFSVIAALAIVVISLGFYFVYSANKKSKQLEYQAYKIYHGDYQEQSLSEEDRFQQALDLFKKAYDKKESPRVLLYIANSHYELGQLNESLENLNDFIKKYPEEKDMLPLAYHRISMIHSSQGNSDEALKALDSLYNLETDIYKDVALIESGRILEKEGKSEEAKAKYRELVEKFPRSPYFTEAITKRGDEETEEESEAKTEKKEDLKEEEKE